MKTIQQNALEAVKLAVQQVNPVLAPSLVKMIGKGTFTTPPIGRGKTIYSTFTPSEPMPQDEAKAILDALETFSKTPTGRDARFSGMTIHGVLNEWTNFIS
jgi:hypothetical protein